MRSRRLDAADKERLGALYEANHQAVRAVLWRFGLDGSRAADVTQQVFLIALERLDDFQPGRDRAFLCGIAARLARRAAAPAREELCEALPELDSGQRPDDELERRRLARMLDGLLAQLTVDLRAALLLHHVDGYSKRELAKLLHIPEGTAASRLRRGRAALEAAHAAALCA